MGHDKTRPDLGRCLDLDPIPSAQPKQFIFAEEFNDSAVCILCSPKIYHIAEPVLKYKIPKKVSKDK